ncbi:hypothetical protein Glove_114g71 [Diversispora epigaea]|uniref:Uncharacterized protein n=1 Tax=Diversispora epigaea TaxID=1348612 RepID=A0A397JA71_9GLOM|nr:hypothetical protein Glove_114g71 [Diversispora epigaea]
MSFESQIIYNSDNTVPVPFGHSQSRLTTTQLIKEKIIELHRVESAVDFLEWEDLYGKQKSKKGQEYIELINWHQKRQIVLVMDHPSTSYKNRRKSSSHLHIGYWKYTKELTEALSNSKEVCNNKKLKSFIDCEDRRFKEDIGPWTIFHYLIEVLKPKGYVLYYQQPDLFQPEDSAEHYYQLTVSDNFWSCNGRDFGQF